MSRKPHYTTPDNHRLCDTLIELAEALDMSLSTIERYSRLGYIKPRRDGRWHTRQVADAIDKHIATRERQTIETTARQLADQIPVEDLTEALLREKIRSEAAKASIAELDLRERRGELVTLQSVTDSYRHLAAFIRNRFEHMPSRLGIALAHLSASHIQTHLEREFTAAFQEIENHANTLEIQNPDL